MRRSLSVVCALAGACFSLLSGCREAVVRPWEIVVQNQSGTYCEIEVGVGPGPDANAPDLGIGERRVLRTGTEKLVVHTIKVVLNRHEHILSPEVAIPGGTRYLILVPVDGNIQASLSAR